MGSLGNYLLLDSPVYYMFLLELLYFILHTIQVAMKLGSLSIKYIHTYIGGRGVDPFLIVEAIPSNSLVPFANQLRVSRDH